MKCNLFAVFSIANLFAGAAATVPTINHYDIATPDGLRHYNNLGDNYLSSLAVFINSKHSRIRMRWP